AVSELLRSVGFGDIVESETEQGVELSTAVTSGTSAPEAEHRFLERCLKGGVEVHTRWQEIDDDWQLAWTRDLQPVQITPALRLVPGLPDGVRAPGDIYLEPALTFG